MANLNTLFDFTKYEKVKVTDQKQFEEKNKVVIQSFVEAVNASFKKLHTVILKSIEPIDQDKNLLATVMSGYLVGFFKRFHPHLCGRASKKRFKLWIDNTSVYIKKLDEKTKLPSNIPTDESLKIFHQLTDPGKEKACNIFLGYTVNDAWAAITGIYAVCIDGDRLLWISDLTSLSDTSQAPIIPMSPLPTAPKVKPGVVRKRAQNE